MDSAVNPLLAAAGSPFTLRSAAGCPPEWADAVTLTQLLDHTGLGMHYVNGVPRDEPFPPVLALISGTADAPAPHRYASPLASCCSCGRAAARAAPEAAARA